jgi:uncharacterized lipoprotein YmbA
MNKNILGLALAVASLLAGCSGSAPVRTEYLLRSDAPESVTQAQAPARFGIGRVVVAPYLDQSGLIIETETREIQPARYHHWAEPLDNSLLLYLRSETSKALGEPVSIDRANRTQWVKTVEVLIEELHGTIAGEALLVATFRISSHESGDAKGYSFAKRAPLADKGYAALVDAEAQLVSELAAAIANALAN